MDGHFNNRMTQQSHRNSSRFQNNRNNREHYVGESFRSSRRNYPNYYGRRHMPYNDPGNSRINNFSQSRSRDSRPSVCPSHTRDLSPVPVSPREAKTLRLINAVQSQEGVNGMLVFLQNDGDNPSVILQNAVNTLKNGTLTVVPGNQSQNYELKINGVSVAEGSFLNKQAAKSGLCEETLDELKKTCFVIIKKKNYEEISSEDLSNPQSNVPEQTSNTMEGSKAHLMMLKMGWGGKGLGINEQGAEKTVAETMTQNITKEGLGCQNIMAEINKILKEFAHSIKVTTLAFDSSFTKDERAHIHSLAAKLNLKSKSEGQGESRRITIAKKIARWDLVKELLLANCENDAYKLIIPSEFENMWID